MVYAIIRRSDGCVDCDVQTKKWGRVAVEIPALCRFTSAYSSSASQFPIITS